MNWKRHEGLRKIMKKYVTVVGLLAETQIGDLEV